MNNLSTQTTKPKPSGKNGTEDSLRRRTRLAGIDRSKLAPIDKVKYLSLTQQTVFRLYGEGVTEIHELARLTGSAVSSVKHYFSDFVGSISKDWKQLAIQQHMINTPKQNIQPPPTEDRLKLLLANGLVDAAQQLIDAHEMPLKIAQTGFKEDGTPAYALLDSLAGTELWLTKYITCDPDTLALKEDIHKLSKCDDEVLIIGETGTGKEMLARALIGNRIGKSIAVNCAGLPENLIESELFGHERGSFTGAEGAKQGLMAAAKDGLLFLDEVGELPMSVQGKLLRAIQDKKIRRVGSNREEDINCKMVFATNRDIAGMVTGGLFRQDLYARISTFEIHVKPLRERRCDIEPIIMSMKGGKEFWEKHSHLFKSDAIVIPHNVRSLQQYVKRWNVLGRI